MNVELWTIFYIFMPFVISGTLFLIITKMDLFGFLGKPINTKLFGKNKTWRGFIIVPLLSALAAVLATYTEWWFPSLLFRFSEHNAALLGMVLGFVFVISELPNSYVKRRLGIPPGKRPERNAWIFSMIDALDAAPGVIIVFILWTDLTFLFLFKMLLVAIILKFSTNYILYLLGIRKEPV